MRRFLVVALLLVGLSPATAEVLQFGSLNTREIQKLDRNKTVLIIPGGILEEHGPYLP